MQDACCARTQTATMTIHSIGIHVWASCCSAQSCPDTASCCLRLCSVLQTMRGVSASGLSLSTCAPAGHVGTPPPTYHRHAVDRIRVRLAPVVANPPHSCCRGAELVRSQADSLVGDMKPVALALQGKKGARRCCSPWRRCGLSQWSPLVSLKRYPYNSMVQNGDL